MKAKIGTARLLNGKFCRTMMVTLEYKFDFF